MSNTPRQRILVVDDEKTNRLLLADLLSEDYEIVLARDGQQALDRASSSEPPDLILLDIVMPGIDGYEVLRRLKENNRTRDIPVVFVTGMSADEDEEKGLNLGAVDYIAKPFRPAIVRARVRNHLNFVWQRKQLEESALVDGLTRIANRRRLDVMLDEEWRRLARGERELSIAMVDIDYFKQFNDLYGHGAGDEVLTAVAAALASEVHRPTDLVARYGGEEFVVLLAETPAEPARAITETMRRRVEALRIPHARSLTASFLTISIGGYTSQPARDTTGANALAVADKALYAAKRQGRNRVIWTR